MKRAGLFIKLHVIHFHAHRLFNNSYTLIHGMSTNNLLLLLNILMKLHVQCMYNNWGLTERGGRREGWREVDFILRLCMNSQREVREVGKRELVSILLL